MSKALLDNDVLYKTTMYGLTLPLLNSKPYGAQSFHILGAAKFIIRKKLTRKPPVRGVPQALSEFELVLQQLREIEPTKEEISLAAEFEFCASHENQSLDVGESLLCAVLLLRNKDYIFTGDKRAIITISKLLSLEKARRLAGKLVCLEQLFKHLILHMNPSEIRSSICNALHVDTALTICFHCHSPEYSTQGFIDGLTSYIDSLSTNAPQVLRESSDN